MTREEWHAIRDNNSKYDGKLFYALRNRNTFCRPSCPALLCCPENVLVFHNIEDTSEKGFIPCPYCHPEGEANIKPGSSLPASAKAYVEAHFREKFSLNDIAGHLFVNRSYLLRVFKEAVGMTLLQYHNYIRCREAEKMLEETNLSISEIASSTGFSSASHFTRVFKNTVGQTPSAYRDSCALLE